jgi:hypothetical protein
MAKKKTNKKKAKMMSPSQRKKILNFFEAVLDDFNLTHKDAERILKRESFAEVSFGKMGCKNLVPEEERTDEELEADLLAWRCRQKEQERKDEEEKREAEEKSRGLWDLKDTMERGGYR